MKTRNCDATLGPKVRECPYCHGIISLRRCLKYIYRGTNYTTVCNHCNRSVKLAKEPIPFKYCVFAGFLSIYLPMNLFLYVYKMSFVDSLIYSLPFVVACILVVGILTFSKIRFSGDM